MFFKVKCNMIIKNTRMLQSMMKRTRFGSWLHSCLSQIRFFFVKNGLKKKNIYIYIYGYSKGCPESGGCHEAVCPQTLCRAPWGHCHMSWLHHAHSCFRTRLLSCETGDDNWKTSVWSEYFAGFQRR